MALLDRSSSGLENEKKAQNLMGGEAFYLT